jgi:hypothetical protein
MVMNLNIKILYHIYIIMQGFVGKTKVLMYNSTIKNIENLTIGDKLMGPDSNPLIISHIEQIFDNTYTIYPKYGEAYSCSSNKNICVYNVLLKKYTELKVDYLQKFFVSKLYYGYKKYNEFYEQENDKYLCCNELYEKGKRMALTCNNLYDDSLYQEDSENNSESDIIYLYYEIPEIFKFLEINERKKFIDGFLSVSEDNIFSCFNKTFMDSFKEIVFSCGYCIENIDLNIIRVIKNNITELTVCNNNKKERCYVLFFEDNNLENYFLLHDNTNVSF